MTTTNKSTANAASGPLATSTSPIGSVAISPDANSQGLFASVSAGAKRPGRPNVAFVPIDNFDFITWDEKQCREYSMSHGASPLFIHQCFQNEVINDWNGDLLVVFFYHRFSLHLYPRIFGTNTNIELGREIAVEKLLQQFTSTIGILSEDLDGPSEYEGLLITTPKSYKDAVNRSLSNTIYGKLIRTMNERDEYIEIYEQKFANKGSVLESTSIPTDTDENRYGDSFTGFHRRSEFMMHFFIESCSAIKNDRNWSIYTMYKVDLDKMGGNYKDEVLLRNPDEKKEDVASAAIGGRRGVRSSRAEQALAEVAKNPHGRDYSTTQAGRSVVCVVSMYRYPGLTSSRSRISQFFTLPFCQGRGYGAMLLSEIYLIIQKDEDVTEINVEDPALAFIQIRDLVALKTAIESKILPSHVIHIDDKSSSEISDPNDSPPWSSTNPGQLPEPHNGYLSFLKNSNPGLSSPSSLFGNISFGNSKSLLTSSNTKSLLFSGSASSDTTSSLAKKPLEPKLQSLFIIMPYIKNIYDICRHKIKESDHECNRLAEMLLLAKYLPNEVFEGPNIIGNGFPAMLQEPPTKKRKKDSHVTSTMNSENLSNKPLFGDDGLRGFRRSVGVTEDLAKLWANDPRIEPVKLFVKMRIINEMDLNPGMDGKQYTAEELIEKSQTGNFHPEALDQRTKQQIQEEWIRHLYSYLRTIGKLRVLYPKGVNE